MMKLKRSLFIISAATCLSAGSVFANVKPNSESPPLVIITLPEQQTLLTGQFSDDGLPLTPGRLIADWDRDPGPGNITFSPISTPTLNVPNVAGTTYTFSTTAVFDVTRPGIYTVHLRVRDGDLPVFIGRSTTTIILRTNPAANQAPVVNAGPDRTLVFTSTFAVLTGTATDDGFPVPPKFLTISWSQVSGPPGGVATFLNASRAQTTASFTMPGTYVLQLSANDGPGSGPDSGGSIITTDTMVVTVEPDPRPNTTGPTINIGGPRTITMPTTGFGTLAFTTVTVTDDGRPNPPGRPLVTWSQVSGPGTVTFNNVSVTTATASFPTHGDYVLQLFATDGELTDTRTVAVRVRSNPLSNIPPVVDASPDQTIANPVNQVSLPGTVTDDGLPFPPSAFTVAWTRVSGTGTVIFSSTNTAATDAVFSAPGDYVLRLTANDGAATSSDTVNIRVMSDPSLNVGPSVNAGADKSITNPIASIAMTGTASDDGLPFPPGLLTIAWSQISGPGTVLFSNVASPTSNATFSAPGIYELQLSADDGVATDTDTVRVTVNSNPASNLAPAVNAGPDLTITNPTAEAFLAGTASDDGLPIPPGLFTVAWNQVSGPGTAAFTDASVAATSVTFSAPGVYVLRIFADDTVRNSSDTITVTVNSDPALNTAPVVNAGPDGNIVNPTNVFFLAGTASDDGFPVPPGALTVAWTLVSGPGTVTFTNPAVAATSATFSAPGVYVLQIDANDNALSTADTVIVTVNSNPALNDAPSVNAGPDRAITNPTNDLFINGTATDDGLPIPPGAFTIAWSQLSGPGTATFTDPLVAATTVTFSAPGVYVLQLSADDTALTGADTVTVTVNSDPLLNQAPVVDAGVDQAITNPIVTANLNGSVSDDDLPVPPGVVTSSWTRVSGPGTATFGDAAAIDTTATFSAPGVYVLELSANDSAATTTDTVTVTVNSDPALNQAPAVDAGPGQAITNPVVTANLAGTAADDGLPVPPGAFTSVWTQVSGPGTIIFGDAAAPATTATFSAPGIYVLALSADDSVATSSDTVTVTVNSDPAANTPPLVSAGPDRVITNPVTQAFLAGTVSDDGLPIPPGAFTIAWSQISGPGVVTFTNGAVAATSATFSAPGVYVLQISADDTAAGAADTVTVTVNSNPADNDAPAVNAGPDGAITLPTNVFFLDGTATDDGLPIPPGAFTVAWSQLSGPGTALFTDPAVAATSVTFSAAGVYVIQISADDSIAASSDTVTVTVNSDPDLNEAPEVNAGPDQAITLPTAAAALNGTAGDDGLPTPPNAFTVAWTQISGPGTATFSDATVAATSVTFSAAGVYVLQLSANDSVASSTDTVTITVNSDPSLNQAPVVSAGADQAITNPVNQLLVSGTASDDGLPNPPAAFTIIWTQVSGPVAATFDDATIAAPTATFLAPGVYVLQILADDSVASSSDTVTITVNSDPDLNQAPVVDAGADRSITNPVNQVVLAGVASDDGLPNPPAAFTVAWTQVSGPGAVTFANAAVSTTTATFPAPGIYVLTLSADDSVATSSDTVTITVNSDPDANSAPAVDAGPDQAITNPVVTAALSGSVTDDGLPIPPGAFSSVWTQLSGPGTVTFGDPALPVTSATFPAPGVYVLQLFADDSVLTSSDTVTITVNSDPAVNTAPVVNAGPDQVITNPVTVAFLPGSATDDGFPNPPAAFTIAWTRVSGPGTVTFTNAAVAATSATFSAPGVYVLQISAGDSAASASDTVTVTVNSNPADNDAPLVSAGPDGAITLPTSQFFLDGTATDDGFPVPPGAFTVAWTQISGPGTATFADGAVAATSVTFSAAGVYVLEISANDSVAASSDTVTITVNSDPSLNEAPQVNAGPDQVITLPTASTALLGTATDDGLPTPPNAFTVAWTQISGPAAATFANASVAATSVTFPAAGVYVLQILADDSVASSTDTVTITVNSDPDLNQAPVVDAGADRSITNPVNQVVLAGVASDDGLPNPPAAFTVAWTQVSGPGAATFANAAVSTTTATFPVPGVYVLALSASDSVASSSDTVTVTVNSDPSGNAAPTVGAGPDQAITNPVTQVFLPGTATDDGLPNPPAAFTVAWSQLSGPGTTTFTDPAVAATSVTFSAPGVYVLQISADDSVAASSDTVTVTVNSDPSLNQAPIVNAGPDQSITLPVNQTFLDGTATDDGLPNPPVTFTVSWTQVSGPGAVIFTDPTVASTSATFPLAGVYVLQISGNDTALSSSDTVTITVNSDPSDNAAPVVRVGSDLTITSPVNQAFLAGTANDDGLPNPPATLTVLWTQISGPGAAAFTDPAVAATSATFPTPGVYVLQLAGSDSVLTTSDTVTVTVNPANTAPVVSAGPDQSITFPTNQVFLDGTATDDGFPNPPATLTVTWSQISGPAAATFDDPSVAATTATFPAAGVYVLQILGDDSVLSSSDTVTVTVSSVTPTNSAPAVNAGPDLSITLPVNQVFLDGTATDDGLPNPPATLTVTWTQISGPAAAVLADPTVAATTATFPLAGVYVLQILGDDGALSSTDTVTITVDSETVVNQAPVVSAGPDQTIINPITQIFIAGTATDDGLPNPPAALTISWTQVSGPAAAVIADATVAATTVTFPVPGIYILQLAGDDSVLASSDTVMITVNPEPVVNGAPAVSAGPDGAITLPANQFFLSGTASDDGLPNPPAMLTVTWSQLSGPAAATFDDPSVAATTATFPVAGVYVLQILGDDSVLSSSDTVTITVSSVTPVNAAPVVDAGSDIAIINPLNQAFLAGTATDDGQPNSPALLTISWTQLSGPGFTTFTDPDVAATSVTFSLPGVYQLQLAASDGVLTSSDTVIVTVNTDPVNAAPVVDAGPDQTITNPVNTAFLAGTASDDGLPNPPATLTVSWTQISGPAAAVFADPSVAATTATFPVPGAYVLQLSGDDSVLSSSDTVTINVASEPIANLAPVVNAGPDGAITLPTNQYFLNGTASDDGLPNPPATLTVTWSLVFGPGPATFSDPSVAATSATFTVAGVYVLQISGNDGASVSTDTVTVTINSNPVDNTAPVVDAGLDVTITNPVTSALLAGSATDDGLPNPPAALTVSWTQVSGPAAVLFANPNAASTNATFPAPGVYVLALSASDSVAASSDTVTVTVNSNPGVNTAPFVNAGPDRSIVNPVNQVFINGVATDDGLPNPPATIIVGWTQVSGPAAVAYGNASVAATTVTFPVSGIYVLRLSASDTVLSSADTVTVVVNSAPGANQPPVVNAGPNQTITNPANQVFLPGSATDDGLPNPPGAFTVSWSRGSGPGTVTFSNLTVAQTSATFSAPGVYVLVLTANDTNRVTADTVTVVVNSNPDSNSAPVVSAGPDRSITIPVNTATLTGTATDDGLPNPPVQLTLTWSQVSGPGAVTFANAAAATTTTTFPVPGTYVLRLSASDTVLSSSDTVTVVVHPVNQAPVVNVGADKRIYWPTNQVTIDATVSDDGEPNGSLTVAWTVVSGPAGVTLSSATGIDTTAFFPSTGTYVLRLTANDSQLSEFDELMVEVILNQKPIVEVGLPPLLTWPENTGHLAGSVTDADGPDPVTAQWSFVSGPAIVIFDDAFSADTDAVFFAPGEYVLRLTAFDGLDLESKTITVTVAPPPAPAPPATGDTVFYPAQGPLSIPLRTNGDGNVRIRVFDILGRLVKDVVDESRPAGDHVFLWEGFNNENNSLSAGIYILYIEADGGRSKKKIALLK